MTALQAAPTPHHTSDVVWFDGELVSARDAYVAPFTHALHYGSGVFEGIRAYATPRATAIFRLRDHIRRLFASAETYGLRIPFGLERLEEAVCETLRANGFQEGYIRPLVFFGARGISLAPAFNCPTHVLIALKALSGSLIGAGSARVTISPWQKTSSKALPSGAKACGHYTNSILALQDAYERGFDEAILLNSKGLVAEGTGENVFVVNARTLVTNDASADILEGITRDTIVTLARERGLRVEVRLLELDDLYGASEVFFTGTAAEVMPIGEIDGRRFPAPGPVTRMLQEAYAGAVRGEESAHPDWLTRLSDGDAPGRAYDAND
ncbi:MAG TPA: branched-chain amino acid transaminase [Verrucomicrobiae bacterium]|nr:branched-chain amino acid transaminase [Verrucomicrobiae bacterium]